MLGIRPHITIRLFSIIALVFTSIGFAYAQLPATNNNKVSLRKEFYGGLQLHTNGWGGTFTYSKFNTFKKKNTYTIEFVSLKHEKEFKRKPANDDKAKGYVYGKLNSVALLRLNKGTKKVLYSKLRERGVEIAFNLNYGVSLAFLKPVYLEILKLDGNQRIQVVTEKYDPVYHHVTNIYGRASNIKGISETVIVPGANIRVGFIFEYSGERDKIRSLEVGIGLDGYYKRLEIMADIKNRFLYPTLYLNFQFGSKKI